MNNNMKGKFSVWGFRQPTIPASISVPYLNHFPASITITPKNKMTGRFETIERPLEIHELASIKDSTIREGIPTLSYGSDPSMLIGKTNSERFRGLVEFDLAKLPKGKELKRAKLKLYCGYLQSPINLALFEIIDDWREHDVTWSNQPPQGKKITEKYITHADGYIEIDVFSLVKEWYEGKTPNHGVFLFAEEQNEQSTIQLQTRESSTPPILEVGFYKLISSLALGKLPAFLSIRANGEDTLTASINVNSKYKTKDLIAQLSILRKSVDTELNCSMDVVGKRNNSMSAFISIEKKLREATIPAELIVRRLEDTPLLSSMAIEKKPRMGQLDASLTVRVAKHQGLFSNLGIKKKERFKQLRANIRVAYAKNLPSTFSIEKKERNRDLTCSLTVRQRESYTLSSSVVIPSRKFFTSQMFVRHVRDFPCSIQVNSGFLNAEIKVRGYRDVQIPATVTVRVRRISDIHARITVRNLQYDSDAGYVFIL
ncbi:DNRLRE domain-containing protein [Brevibacillus laterosporus]|uniref:DNRLRE domain-containing protein n=1 Tax=Brevibacillus laterosporus TaxID=1465 RepID=UPI003D1B4792